MVVFPLHLFLIFAMEELREEERPQTLWISVRWQLLPEARGGDKMMRVAGPFDALLDLQVLAPQHTTNHKEIATCRVDERFARIRLGWGRVGPNNIDWLSSCTWCYGLTCARLQLAARYHLCYHLLFTTTSSYASCKTWCYTSRRYATTLHLRVNFFYACWRLKQWQLVIVCQSIQQSKDWPL